MVITSGGIYGFLSGAFAETNTQSQFLDKQIEIQTSKQNTFIEKKEDLTLEKTALVQTISDLRISLSNPTQVSYYSEDAGQVITTSSTSARKALQKELNITIAERDTISQQINAVTDSIAVYDIKILEQQIGNESARELGPLKYMAELTGKPMEQIVNWFMLLIIFVFDPLAIAMVVAANMAFAQIKKPTKNEAIKEKIIIKKVPIEKIIEKEVIKEVPVEKIVEKIVEVEKKEDPKDYKVYKDDKKGLKAKDERIEEKKKNKKPPYRNSWGSPGGMRG